MAAVASVWQEPTRGDAALLARVAELAKPVSLAGDQVLPVLPALTGLFPWGGLSRGAIATAAGPAARSLLFALAAGPLAAGAWAAAVGVPGFGLLSAGELGLPLDRLVLVETDGASGVAALTAAVDAFDVVLAGPGLLNASQGRRLQARARERGAVVLLIGGAGPVEVDHMLQVTSVRWFGLSDGHGTLRSRQITVAATGRRSAARERKVTLWLPGPDGQIAVVEEARPVRLTDLSRPEGGVNHQARLPYLHEHDSERDRVSRREDARLLAEAAEEAARLIRSS